MRRFCSVFLLVICSRGLILPIFASEPFSLVIVPDTQFYTETRNPDGLPYFSAQTGWVVSNRETRNIRFVLHEGDLTQTTFTQVTNRHEWTRAQSCLRAIDGVVPYALVYGNHDFCNTGWRRDTSLFNEFFPLSVFSNQSTYGGSYQAGKSDNTYHLFTAGAVDWLVLALEFAPRDEVLTWAGQVVAANSNRQVMVLTHVLLYQDGLLHGAKSAHDADPHEYAVIGPVNGGTEIWDKFLRRYPNITFAFNGHVVGQGLCVTNGDYGNRIYLMAANYQHESNGGSGFLRVLNFDPTQREVRVETYSPKLGQFKTDTRNQFTLSDAAFFNPAAPERPEQVVAEALGSRGCRLTWTTPTGGAAEATGWAVYRNGQPVGRSTAPWYKDEGLMASSTHRYRVQAFSPAGRPSGLSDEVEVVLSADEAPPRLISAGGLGPTNIVLVFDQPLNEISATTIGHYVMGKGCLVMAARLEPDQRTVVLTTTPMLGSQRYPLSVNHLQGRELGSPRIDEPQRVVIQDRPDLLSEDFDDGDAQGWTLVDEKPKSIDSIGQSSWSVQTGKLAQTALYYGPTWGAVARRKGSYAYWAAPEALQWTDYAVQATCHATYDGGVGLMFRFQDTNNFYRFEMDNRFRYRKLFRVVNGVEDLLAWAWAVYPPACDQVLRVEVQGESLCVYLNGTNVFGRAIEDASLSSGSVGLYGWRNQVFFDQVTVQSLSDRLLENRLHQGMTGAWIQNILNANPHDELVTEDDFLASDDYDGDGLSNESEFWAGTDPVDIHSVLTMHEPGSSMVSNGIVVRWASASNRVYMLMRSNKLSQGFQVVADPVPATHPFNTYTDTPPAWDCLFYRVAIHP